MAQFYVSTGWLTFYEHMAQFYMDIRSHFLVLYTTRWMPVIPLSKTLYEPYPNFGDLHAGGLRGLADPCGVSVPSTF